MAQNGLYFTAGIDLSQLEKDAKKASAVLASVESEANKHVQQSVTSIGESSQKAFDGAREHAQRSFARINDEAEDVGDAFKRATGLAVGFFGITSAMGLVKQIFAVRSEMEQLEKSFEVLLGGDKNLADTLFREIKEFAASTPMQISSLASAAKMMIGFNIEATKVMPILKALGDVSMGDEQRFQSLALAFSQMSSTGKLMGQDLLQMINAGFNPLMVISEKTGKSIAELKDEMGKGAISSEMVEDAFLAATAAGGKFHNMLNEQSEGLAGGLAQMRDAITMSLNEMGGSTQGIMTGVLKAATYLIKHYKDIGVIVGGLVAGYGIYKAAVITVVAVEKAAAAARLAGLGTMGVAKISLKLLTAQVLKLNAAMLANPAVLVAAAVAALTYGIYKLATHTTEAEKAQKRMSEATQKLNDDIYSETSKADRLFDKLKAAKEGTEEYQNAKNAIIAQYGSLLDKYSDEIRTLRDVEGAYRAVTDAVSEMVKAKIAEQYQEGEIAARTEQINRGKIELKEEMKRARPNVSWKLMEDDYNELVPLLMGNIDPSEFQKKILERYGKVTSSLDWRYAGTNSGQGSKQYSVQKVLDFHREQQELAEGRIDQFYKTLEANRRRGKDEEKPDLKLLADDKILDELIAKQQEYNALKAGGDKEALENAKKELAEYKRILETRAASLDTEDKFDKLEELLGKKSKTLTIKSDEKGYVDTMLSDVRKRKPKTEGKAESEAERKRKELEKAQIQERVLLERQARERERQARDLQWEETDVRILAMQEGFAKQLAVLELNYQKQKAAVDDYQRQLIERARERKKAEFDKSGKKAEFDPTSIGAESLTDEDRTSVDARDRLAEDARAESLKKALKEELQGIATYAEQRAKILEDAKQKEAALRDDKGALLEGVSEENIAELGRQTKEQLEALDLQIAEREAYFSEWAAKLVDLSLSELTRMIKVAEEQLKAAEKASADPKKLALFRAQMQKLKEEEKKRGAADAVKQDLPSSRRTMQEWQELYRTLGGVKNAFDEIGDAIGGTAGDAVKAAGSVATSTLSMIDGIMTFATTSIEGVKGAKTAAETAIKGIEAASVILAVITAAISIASKIAAMFGNKEKKRREKELSSLDKQIAELKELADSEQRRSLSHNGIEILDEYNKVLAETKQRLGELNGVGRGAFSDALSLKRLLKDGKATEEALKRIAGAYARLAYTADKALGEDRFKASNERIKANAKQQLLLQAKIAELESAGKNRDQKAIDDAKKQVRELAEEAKKSIDEVLEEIMGGSARSYADELGNAMIDAFSKGEDAAKAWGDTVDKIVGNILKRLLIQKFLEIPMGKIFDKYKDKLFNEDGTAKPIDEMMKFLEALIGDLNREGENFSKMLEGLNPKVKEMLMGSSREASKKGIAAASQDSIDELNGRMTSVQAHTFSIAQGTRTLAENSHNILRSVVAIEYNTTKIIDRIDGTNREVASLRRQVETAASRGIKVK